MKFKITLKQYQTIYRIVASLGEDFSYGAGKSCQFYNVTGAYILSKILKIKARPVMGAAFFVLKEGEQGTLSFAEIEENAFSSSPDGFHCWIETNTHYIDFTAPEYSEALGNSIPQKMFQKPKSSMVESIDLLRNTGDFLFSVNEDLTNHLLTKMASIPASTDLANICADWYKKNQKKIVQSINIINDLGEFVPVKLKKCSLKSAW